MINSISFVMPMYNEKDNIETVVSECLRVGYMVASEVELVVVDDASTDGCGEILDNLATKHPEVVALHHKKNRKLGGALKTGFANVSKEWVLYIDSDLPVKMDDLLEVVYLTDTYDVIIGWRKSRAESWRREVMSKVYNKIIRLMYDLHVKDVNFAFKLFKSSLLKEILLTAEGSFIDAEFLLEMQRIDAKITEVGMNYYPRVAGVSTLASNSVIIKILQEMIRYRIEAYGKLPDNFSGERRRLWSEQVSEQRDTISIP
ncbi:MAG: glycosyltransferase family 2 protein [Armatimonadota bacterium]